MKTKVLSLILLLSVSFTLVACSNELKTMSSAADKTEETVQDLSTNLNEINSLEEKLQSQFEQTLAEDDELSTFADKSAPVFANIESRKDYLDNVKKSNETLDDLQANLGKVEGEQFTDGEIDDFYSKVEKTVKDLKDYSESYQSSLDKQANYFEGLSAEDADYEKFQSGLSDIQSDDEKIRTLLTELNSDLQGLDQTATTINEKVTTLESQNK